jgi:hypothetical protein
MEHLFDESEKEYQEILNESRKIFQEENRIISRLIQDKFKTVVNDFGCIHYSEERFIEFILPKDKGKFEWCNYFIIPVDFEDSVVLPKTYNQDSKSFFKSYSDLASQLRQYKAAEYYDSLANYQQLKQFTEEYTEGATAVLINILKHPLISSKERLIDEADEIEDLGYLVLCYYVNF